MTTAIANERLQKRFDRWDADGNGSLERADFEREAEQIAGSFGKQLDAPEVQALRQAFLGLFEFLANEAEVGADGSITKEVFLRVTEKLIYQDGEAAFNRALSPLVKGIVGLCDKNADGQINGDEFAAWLVGIGLDRAEATEAFAKIDKNNSGELSVDELLDAVRDFHFGKLNVELLG